MYVKLVVAAFTAAMRTKSVTLGDLLAAVGAKRSFTVIDRSAVESCGK